MNQRIDIDLPYHLELYIKREDLLHPYISGNKFRKLKYNVEEALKKKANVLITFGGAFSNHILATAAAGKEYGIATIGIIRGEEWEHKLIDNPTLSLAKEFGMEFEFVSRTSYAQKEEIGFLRDIKQRYLGCYILPEGGTNSLAIKGCEEILEPMDCDFDYVCCAVGTGGTLSGIINASNANQKIVGFSALKGNFLSDVICNFVTKKNWTMNSEYHFGGYGKVTDELIAFLNDFYQSTSIPLDPIYTGKMMFGVLDMIQKREFPENSKILLIHTGGLQGIQGINQKRGKKNKELLQYT
ncbi:MAG: 1-aminocyclopropane-1-carboxylate deaminase [Flavobacterium sp.]|uniref:1-aminocyclopropane-1-carboxylate deaminase/D-cysteine desulfhydrase n=1 Tax=Flavobacterium sp. TaxID=239 RepID=UPI000C3DD581|nr:pyridoxal-phosphate dependent enzyme [Flavobacterium sp.]MBF03763.1 1-aminocyclopropane-1-carboxylate deaminase [Flavobacterium sp.]